MGDALKKVQAGQPLEIPAEAYNAFLDAARAQRSKRHDREQESLPPFRQADIILVRNDSPEDRARFHILGLSSPIVSPTANADQFKNQVALAGVRPLVPDHFGKFAVLLEPLEVGAIGRAWASGVCPARVNVTDVCAQFADVADDDPTSLRSVPRGAARILWREGGLGTQWAVLRLSNSPSPLRRFKLLSPLVRCGSASAQRVVYSETGSGNPRWCRTDCNFTLFDSLGIAPVAGAAAGSFGWAIWMSDSGRWELVALGEGCCPASSATSSGPSASSEPSSPPSASPSSAPSTSPSSAPSTSPSSEPSKPPSSAPSTPSPPPPPPPPSSALPSSGQPSFFPSAASSQSDKSTAIVPASWSRTGYTALFIAEMPEVRFDDVMTVSVTDEETLVSIDPRFLEVCEPNTVQVCGCVPDSPVPVGAVVESDKVRIRVSGLQPFASGLNVVIRLTGIRKGFASHRFPDRTEEQFLANEAFIRSAYPGGRQ